MSSGATKTYKSIHTVRAQCSDGETLKRLREGTLKAFIFWGEENGRGEQIGCSFQPIMAECWQLDCALRLLETGYTVEGDDPPTSVDGLIVVEEVGEVKNKGGRPAAEAWAIAAAEAIDIGIETDPKNAAEFVRMIMERIGDNGPPGEVQIERCIRHLFKARAERAKMKKRA